MKLTVVFVFVFYFVTVFVTQSVSFKILKKLKDFLHPTTSTTTPVPTTTKWMEENSASTTTPIGNKYNSDNNKVDYEGHNSHKDTSSKESSSEESRERPSSPEHFPTIAPQHIHEVYPGMSKRSTTPRYDDSKSQKKTTEQTSFFNSNYDSFQTTQSTNDVNLYQNQPFQTTYHNLIGNEVTTTLQINDLNYTNLLGPGQENTSTVRIPTTIKNNGINNMNQLRPEKENAFPGEVQTTTLQSNGVNYLNELYNQGNTFTAGVETSTIQNSGVSHLSEVHPVQENTNTSEFQTTTLQSNTVSYTSQLHPDQENTYTAEFQTTTFRSNDMNFINNLHPDQENNRTPPSAMGQETALKPQKGYGNINQSNEDVLIFPDNPCLNSTKETSKQNENGTSEVRDCLSASTVNASTARRPGKVRVPVGDDGGRRIIDAPVTDCGKGRKLDGSGNCRKVARK